MTAEFYANVLVFETMSHWILPDEASSVPPPSVYMVSKTKAPTFRLAVRGEEPSCTVHYSQRSGRACGANHFPFPHRAFPVTAIICSHAALFFRRFFGGERSFSLGFRMAGPAPALPIEARNAAFGAAAIRDNSSGFNSGGCGMTSRSLSQLHLLSMALPDGFFRMPAERIAHGRKPLVLKIGVGARTEPLIERRG